MTLRASTPWSSDEDGVLRMLAADGRDKLEISDIVKRTPLAVQARAGKLKVKFKYEHKTRPFSEDEDKALIACSNAGLSQATIATKLRRSLRGIRRRSEVLGLRFPETRKKNRLEAWADGRLGEAIDMWVSGTPGGS